MIPLTWNQVEARPESDFVVAPDERLGWARTVGIGAQHVVAMFGATFLVPVLTGFPPATTLLFSAISSMGMTVCSTVDLGKKLSKSLEPDPIGT